MRCYLVVAHKTMIDDHVLEKVREVMGEEQARFHLIVPVHHPNDRAWTDGEVQAEAQARLDEAREKFQSIGALVTGEVGDANPVEAVQHYLYRGEPADGVFVSTLPSGLSQWLRLDVPSRLRRVLRVPVHHLEAERAPTS